MKVHLTRHANLHLNILESDKTAAVSIVRPSVLDRVADKNRGIEQGLDRESGETKNVIDAIPALLAKVDKAAARVLASDVAKHCPPGIKQRWAKDKYNAYQREYMRTRRANLRAGINE